MSKKAKRRILRWSIVLIVLIVIGVFGFVRRTEIANGLSTWLTKQTIPFNLVVSPDAAAAQETVKGVDLDGNDSKRRNAAVAAFTVAQQRFSVADQNYTTFLSPTEAKRLKKWVNDKPYQYISDLTMLGYGRDTQGSFLYLSANRYQDTPAIWSYRYRIYYRGDQLLSSYFAGRFQGTVQPQFIVPKVGLGTPGNATAVNFLTQIKNGLGRADLYEKINDRSLFVGIARQLGLDDASAAGLQMYLRRSNGKFNNSAITSYVVTDAPRVTRFTLVVKKEGKRQPLTLVFDRNKSKFTQLRVGDQNPGNQRNG
ncbi:hypothetical protein [Schleiferilactobacillus shenzhenensis]|uniref:Uncharacterized protein n=1 Tax=Schleiferilactobacillus shenzhenensis LY-73 TaxID=1231336 RepID=U4TPK7_9LACO|nr:hypothetical protein [Schleiferilactobacillus shenzhenensis]ERL65370.1 hypothetical protein L248_2769 [Schleiferilactobacillus shenzhenensis LY-73]